MTNFFFKCDVTCSWTLLPLSQTVTLSRTPYPLERDVLYGRPQLSGHLDVVAVGDSPVLGGRERLYSLDYLQGYFTPEILNRIHILQMGGQGQRPGVVLAFTLDCQFSTMTLFTNSNFILQKERILE